MKKLSYQTLEDLNYNGYLLREAPERVLQFGEGNFLRAFADCFIDRMNEKGGFCGKVVLVQPNARPSALGLADQINAQDGLYTLYLRGFQNGKKINEKRIVSCVSRCLNMYRDYDKVMACAENADLRFIICNTTEAGIVYDPECQFDDVPPSAFPAKLTQFLYRRFQVFGRETGKGLVLLPCELIDNNGKELKNCVLYLAFYHGTELTEKGLLARRPNGDVYTVSDDRSVLEFFYDHRMDSTKDLVHAVSTNQAFWGMDLSVFPEFEETVCRFLDEIRENGVLAIMKHLQKNR